MSFEGSQPIGRFFVYACGRTRGAQKKSNQIIVDTDRPSHGGTNVAKPLLRYANYASKWRMIMMRQMPLQLRT
jgi:hypothetical protein